MSNFFGAFLKAFFKNTIGPNLGVFSILLHRSQNQLKNAKFKFIWKYFDYIPSNNLNNFTKGAQLFAIEYIHQCTTVPSVI